MCGVCWQNCFLRLLFRLYPAGKHWKQLLLNSITREQHGLKCCRQSHRFWFLCSYRVCTVEYLWHNIHFVQRYSQQNQLRSNEVYVQTHRAMITCQGLLPLKKMSRLQRIELVLRIKDNRIVQVHLPIQFSTLLDIFKTTSHTYTHLNYIYFLRLSGFGGWGSDRINSLT